MIREKKVLYLVRGIILALLVICIVLGIYTYNKNKTDISKECEVYIRNHISQLSPREEVLGGTRYVTKVVFSGTQATVDYEDGHIAAQLQGECIEQNNTVIIQNITYIGEL